MGTLFYDGQRFELSDRVLAHLQVIIGLKLRRKESFFISWQIGPGEGSGRNVIWIDNGIPIRFKYDGSRPPQINREWAESLSLSANTSNGLFITDERITSEA
ncbi:hypothetical protein N3K63_06130 [Microbacterium sp. W1N]|uniref:DUF7882 family protein n=1 Tax=Microbacterium festucae TaxID=2977531 RepID=UPI0021BF6591|nr:hypothetical protein [Microbacterium festucae]MCT9819864.1 hypothetical protein [Microbacterium festucae]